VNFGGTSLGKGLPMLATADIQFSNCCSGV
jgi:hypothetical protein